MPQHFLKSAAYRDFPPALVGKMSEEESFCKFVEIRWGGFKTVFCPQCAVIDKHYYRRTRRQWRCKHCDAYFSVTTGTPFQNHQLSFKAMLFGIAVYLNAPNGVSNNRLSSEMGVQVKTAQAFIGKLRESLYNNRDLSKLKGLIHMDGGHFGGRPRNGRVRRRSNEHIKAHINEKLVAVKNSRKGRSRANWDRLKNRRIIITLRELYPDPGLGACRTLSFICMAESEQYAVSLARHYIEDGSTIMTDENAAYNQFSRWYDHKTVQHAIEFATIDGVSDNQAESYFSRVRRYTHGVGHRIEPKYMADIANEMAWREDMRRKTQREKLHALLGTVFKSGLSQWWRGYWQGINRPGELLWKCE